MTRLKYLSNYIIPFIFLSLILVILLSASKGYSQSKDKNFDANSLQSQRIAFKKWQSDHDELTQIEQQKYLKELALYPLYPYVLADYLTDSKNKITNKDLVFFDNTYPNFPNLIQVKQAYVLNLTKIKNWQAIVDLNDTSSTALKCQLIYADYQLHPSQKKLQQVSHIWTQGFDLPSSCDSLFKLWSATPYKTKALILERVDLLLKNNKLKLAALIANQLPASESQLKKALVNVIQSPKTLPQFVSTQSNQSVIKEIVLDLFARYSTQDKDGSRALIKVMQQKYKLNQSELNRLYDNVAQSYFATNTTPQQVKWRQNYIEKSNNVALIEQEIRIALRQNNKSERDKWLKLLSDKDKQKEEWRYWTAIMLAEQGNKEQAKQLLAQLATERGFYGLASAQKLGVPYKVNLEYELIENMPKKEAQNWIQIQYQSHPDMKIMSELKAHKMTDEAKKQWRSFVLNQNKNTQAQLAKFAYDQNWAIESIQATIMGEHWDNWNERLPIVYPDLFEKELQDKAISKSYSLAISRQESALDPAVQSHAGARGLMQLMPATAKEMAKRVNSISYSSSQDLFKPEVNIALGTSFLNLVYEQFDHNRILASAAYNAGPGRVNQWLKQTDKQLDVIAFIESIPFTETRNYVKSVLTYDYLYQLRMKQNPNAFLTEKEWLKRY